MLSLEIVPVLIQCLNTSFLLLLLCDEITGSNSLTCIAKILRWRWCVALMPVVEGGLFPWLIVCQALSHPLG